MGSLARSIPPGIKKFADIKKLVNVFFDYSFTRDLRKSVAASLDENHLPMAFQPIIDHVENQIFAYEALARPICNTVAVRPDIWFHAAYELGNSLQADILSIRSAITQSRLSSRKQKEDPLLFVNTIASSLTSEEFLSELILMFEEGLCRPEQLVLEITEHVSYDCAELSKSLKRLRKLGLRFALDDLGLGASNLTSIVELEPDFIKLDRALIAGISISQPKQRMLSQLVQYMGSGDFVVAEGIERVDDLEAVKQAGVSLTQGYFWSEPQPFDLLPNEQQLFDQRRNSTNVLDDLQLLSAPVCASKNRNGTVQIRNGQLIVTDPEQIGNFATIEIPVDPQLRVIVNGSTVTNRIIVRKTDHVTIEFQDIESISSVSMKVSPDKMEVIAKRRITPGVTYSVMDKDEARHIVLEVHSEVVYPDPLSVQDIVRELSSGYRGTIDQDAVQTLCDTNETVEVTVLRGIIPTPGTPDTYAEIERPRKYDPLRGQRQRATVTVGTKVGTVVSGTPGIPGYNVFGEVLPPPSPAASAKIGPGISRIGDALVAVRNGRILFRDDLVDIVPEIVIGRDLTAKDGHVNFDGDVIIYGSVLDGANVEALGTVTVHGSVLCATVRAEHGIYVSGTVVGSEVIAGQSRFLYKKVEPSLRKCLTNYIRFRDEYRTLLERAKGQVSDLTMIAGVLMEQRHPYLLNAFEQLIGSLKQHVPRDIAFTQLARELQSKWLVIRRTKIDANDVEGLFAILSDVIEKIQSAATAKPAPVRVTNGINSSIVNATGKIIVKSAGVHTSTLESDHAVLIRGNVRGGFITAKNVVRVSELGTKSGTETSVRVLHEDGLIAVRVRNSNTLLQVGQQRDRNFEVQHGVVYRGR